MRYSIRPWWPSSVASKRLLAGWCSIVVVMARVSGIDVGPAARAAVARRPTRDRQTGEKSHRDELTRDRCPFRDIASSSRGKTAAAPGEPEGRQEVDVEGRSSRADRPAALPERRTVE